MCMVLIYSTDFIFIEVVDDLRAKQPYTLTLLLNLSRAVRLHDLSLTILNLSKFSQAIQRGFHLHAT